MKTIIPDTGVEHPNIDANITYLEKNNIYKAVCQKLSKNYLYETDMHKIYNLILVQTNNKL